MYVGRPHRVTTGRPYQFADRAIGRNRIAAGQNRSEREAPVMVGDEPRAERGALLAVGRLLRVVKSVVVRVPDVDLCTRQRLAVEIGDSAAHEHCLAVDPC